MIPKKIHYCWFGGNPLDEVSLRCIESWKKYFPEYEIIQWNEQNFDVFQMDFMRKAYQEKKWAFVSDVARLLVIYEHGGLYFDTDVEVISDYHDILNSDIDGFLGIEKTNTVNTGLGFGAVPNHPFIKKMIHLYRELEYDQYSDCLSEVACPVLMTRLMEQDGYRTEDILQKCCGFAIYPSEYFAPMDYLNGTLFKTDRTHSIHWYNASWQTAKEKEEWMNMQKMRRIFGAKYGDMLYGIRSCLKQEGVKKYLAKRIEKFCRKKRNA